MAEKAIRRLRAVNAVGFGVLTVGGILADVANTLGARADRRQWLGGLTNHVGDTGYGVVAVLAGVILCRQLQLRGADHKLSRALGFAATALVTATAVAAEQLGILNNPEWLDLPAIAVAIVGTYSIARYLPPVHREV